MITKLWNKLPVRLQELVSYGFFGVLTTIVNYGVYLLCTRLFHLDIMIANSIAWILAVLFAYVTNKIWVFGSHDWSPKHVRAEASVFVGARLFSGLVDIAGLALLVSALHINDLIGKIITNIIVIIMNYVLSKLLVFRNHKQAR